MSEGDKQEMTETTRENRDHLQPEDLESLATATERSLPAHASAHVAECGLCRRKVEELTRLHAVLVALSPLLPASGFVDRVMRRVRLPVPWRVRILATARAHWVATAAAFAGLAGAIGFGTASVARYPDLTPMAVAAFIVERSMGFLWGLVMEAGRLVYGSGIVGGAQGILDQLTFSSAFLAVATVTLVGLGALRIMLSLLNVAPGTQPVNPA